MRLKIWASLVVFLYVVAYCEYPLRLSASSTDILNFVGSSQAKIVFVNRSQGAKTLQYIDFSEQTASDTAIIHTIAAAINPTAPVISPDGRWVAYASAPGTSGENGVLDPGGSSIYICRIAENATPVLLASDSAMEPRFVQHRDKLTILYPIGMNGGSWDGPGKTMTIEIDTSGGVAAPGTPTVFFGGGTYNAGLSYDEEYLGAGAAGIHVVMLDRKNGNTIPDTVDHRYQVTPPFATAYGSNSCNASISWSHIFTDCIMHLDGGSYGSTSPLINNGLAWGQWEVIFIVDISGTLLRQFPYPKISMETLPDSSQFKNKPYWHHPEWSNHPYFADATLNVHRSYLVGGNWNNSEYQERIFILNIRNGQRIQAVEPSAYSVDSTGAGVYWPWLWIAIPDTFTEDSTWLSSLSAPVHRGVSATVSEKALSFDGRTVYSPEPISRVSLRNLLGEEIVAVRPQRAANSLDISSLLHVTAGIYFVKATTVSGTSRVFRYVCSK